MSISRIFGSIGEGLRVGALGSRLFAGSAGIACAALILHPAAIAQERFGNFVGIVTDPSGAVLPDVTVTLTNKENNRVLTTKTDGSGSYVFRQVEPGR